jgi:alpha-galactosidase
VSALRIVIIGGGSYGWAPLFCRDLALTPELAGSTIVLHDIDAAAMELVYRVGQRLIAAAGADLRLVQTASLGEALAGADAVILTITTGGLAAMRHDLEIPARYGIAQSVGDTVGPGGLSRGLRAVPVVAGIAREMARHCPDAWLLNYTNPMSTLTRVVGRETAIKVVGLCHEWLGVRAKLAAAFALPEAALEPRLAGINHLVWLLDLAHDGRCLMPDVRALAAGVLAGDVELDPDDDSPMGDHGQVKARLLQLYGGLPCAGDRHVAEFFPHFLTAATGWGETYRVGLTTVEHRAAWRADDRARLEAILSGELDVAPFLAERSDEAAHSILAALATGGTYRGIMNLPNAGQIGNLPPGVVVETLGEIDRRGARGLPAGDLPPGIHAVVSRHISNQELIVEAALTGDIGLARQALLNDPLVSLPPETAVAMLDELLAANHEHLPHFFDHHPRTQSEIIT